MPTDIAPTVAEGIATSKPTRVAEVLRAVRDIRRRIVAVSEAEIVEALRDLARRGLYVEPTSAAAAAGLTRLLADGSIRPQRAHGARADGLRAQGLRHHRRAAEARRPA